jgi:hypothetical protein
MTEWGKKERIMVNSKIYRKETHVVPLLKSCLIEGRERGKRADTKKSTNNSIIIEIELFVMRRWTF